ncbi:ankyrin repeat domain-containing protein 60 [Sceloporus undulatus]|uniref:ankyrin repeat domain-containing protein 60 n=1 Tax=Sceloporus undulatus TaxID=8520 RepID=UPI001C4CE3EB|nr:ankyrin repeat domain-containing protein 60 [Sceloporus undulatus]
MKKKKKRELNAVFQSRIGTSSRFTALLPERSLRSGELSSPQTRIFNVKLHVVETDESVIVPECQHELTIRNLKSRMELMLGIPVNFQRLQYLDEVDLDDNSTFKENDIIPGGTLTMRIWPEDAWGLLVSAAAKGRIEKLEHVGATSTSLFSTANAELMGPEEKSEWLAHRAFVALLITVRRGNLEAVEFLLQNGADLKRKTPLGRTALHVAATSDQIDCIDILLNYGAKFNQEDQEGYTPAAIARQWGQKESERRIFRYQWKKQTVGAKKQKLKETAGVSFQR